MKIIILISITILALFAYSCTPESEAEKGLRIDLDVAEFKTKMSEPNTVLLDVRTPSETKNGTIDGALEINVMSTDFKNKIQDLDKNKTYLVYCRSGRRSVKACKEMEKVGFEKLVNLKGGYKAWKK